MNVTEEDIRKMFYEVRDIFAKHHLRPHEEIGLLLGMAAELSYAIYQMSPEAYARILQVWEGVRDMMPAVPHERNKGAGVA